MVSQIHTGIQFEPLIKQEGQIYPYFSSWKLSALSRKSRHWNREYNVLFPRIFNVFIRVSMHLFFGSKKCMSMIRSAAWLGFYNPNKHHRGNIGRHKKNAYPNVERNPETFPSAYREMISPVWRKLAAISPIFLIISLCHFHLISWEINWTLNIWSWSITRNYKIRREQ